MVPAKVISKWLLAPLFGVLLCLNPAAQAQTRSGPVEVPFEFVHNQILIQAKIGGKGPYTLVIDTNADSSSIDPATAKELGLTAGPLLRLPSLEIGSVTAKDVTAAVADLTKLATKLQRPIQGVLGYSFLKDRIIQIDYAASKIRFYLVSPYASTANSPNTVNIVAVPFRFAGGVMIDAVFINGEKLKARLDTGSSGTFTLTPEAVALLGIEDPAPDGRVERSLGDNGESETKSGVLKSVRLGRLVLESAPASFWPTGAGYDKANFQVSIGNGFFKDYLMTFDFRGKIVVFEQPDD